MNNDALFLNTIKDIQARLKSNDPYEILLIAGLLRKLLLDESPLLHQVNRTRKIKIRFRINDRPAPNSPGLVMWSIQDGFDPDTSVPHLTTETNVNLQTMLKKPVMMLGNETINVQDLIKYLSHVLGAVHSGAPKNKKEEALKGIENHLQVGGISPTIRSILSITRVIVKALKPLADAIANEGS